MIGFREICALLIGGAVSVPATVVVVRDLPAKSARAQTPAKVKPARAVPVPEQYCIQIWPTVGMADLTLVSVPEFGAGWSSLGPATERPGVFAPVAPGHPFPVPPLAGPWPLPEVPPVSPPVPEPAQWMMLLAGFGLVGLASRRVRRRT